MGRSDDINMERPMRWAAAADANTGETYAMGDSPW
jgi:hypothetical protein